MAIEIRSLTAEDVPAVVEIEKQCFAAPWSEKEMFAECQNKMAHYVVLCADGAVVGYGGFWHIVDEAHITNIAVSPDCRRKGYGESILKAMLECAKGLSIRAATLEVRSSNVAAQALYEKEGFYWAGIRRQYYLDNREDAYIYWKEPL